LKREEEGHCIPIDTLERVVAVLPAVLKVLHDDAFGTDDY
jgi:hypothetical protein